MADAYNAEVSFVFNNNSYMAVANSVVEDGGAFFMGMGRSGRRTFASRQWLSVAAEMSD